MSASSSSPPAGAAQKTRSPVERAIVWGVIIVLLGLVGVEYSARNSYDGALNTLREKMEAVDTAEGAPPVTEEVVKATVGGKAPEKSEILTGKGKVPMNGAARVDVFSWFTLNPFAERRMYVYYGVGEKGVNPEVIEIKSEEVGYQEAYKPVELKPITEDERAEYAYTHDNYGQVRPGRQEEMDKMTPEEKDAKVYKRGASKKDAPKKDTPKDDAAKNDESKSAENNKDEK